MSLKYGCFATAITIRCLHSDHPSFDSFFVWKGRAPRAEAYFSSFHDFEWIAECKSNELFIFRRQSTSVSMSPATNQQKIEDLQKPSDPLFLGANTKKVLLADIPSFLTLSFRIQAEKNTHLPLPHIYIYIYIVYINPVWHLVIVRAKGKRCCLYTSTRRRFWTHQHHKGHPSPWATSLGEGVQQSDPWPSSYCFC